MSECKFYLAGHTAALSHAAEILKHSGIEFLPRPGEDVTHLLLPVPSFDPEGFIKGSGSLEALLAKLPKDITVIGGNLSRPELENYKVLDLLTDPQYIAANASITAHCAVKLAMNKLPVVLEGQNVLVIGWGRIGKCLAQLLKSMGAKVTVAARKETDRSMLQALGFGTADTATLDILPYRVVFNTVPAMISPQSPGSALKIDLASRLGLGSLDVIWARGLPGREAPESSGALIARTVLRQLNEKE